MLFATYGAPPAQPKQSNPLPIILGVCGGGCLLLVIGAVIFFAVVFNASKGFINSGKGFINGAANMPVFLMNVQQHNYTKASSLVEPSSRETLSADKLKAMEEKVEKQLGPPDTSTAPKMTGSGSDTNTGPNGQPQSMNLVYKFSMKYKKGTATASISLKSKKAGSFPEGISDFTIEPDSGSGSN